MGIFEITALALASFGLIVLIAAALLLGRVCYSLYAYSTAIKTFVSPPLNAPDDASPLQQMLGGVIGGVGSSLMQSQKMSDLGTASGEARQELAARADLIEGMLQKEKPEWAILAAQMFGPQWAKKIAKNPAYISAAQNLMGEGGILNLFGKKEPEQAALTGLTNNRFGGE